MELSDEIEAVKTLTMPDTSNTRDFAGLSALKIAKKDRHIKTLYDFAKFLEATNENVVQEVLNLTRTFRESMEVTDEELEKFCADIHEDDFLLPRSEKDLLSIREDLVKKIEARSDSVETFAYDLDNTETKRAAITGAELKRLVDKLIAIAHQLPDDIEHIVEAEAFELNSEIITNKKAHAQTMAEHKIKQVQLEDMLLNKWEDSRRKWRQLRHEKGLNDFREHIASDEFNDPYDRQEYMREFRDLQDQRRKTVQVNLGKLRSMLCNSITSEAVVAVQQEFAAVNEIEIDAIQNCYNRLSELRSGLAYFAQERVEALRHELHVYGALKVEPDLNKVAVVFESALNDESLAELWRLGGGLKMEFQAQVEDMRCDEVIYERVVEQMQKRIETISCSFTLKAVLEERGRAAQLEKVRGLITKMRTAPRSELTGVLRSLLPELESVEEIELLPELFKQLVKEVADEIHEELAAVEKKAALATQNLGNSSSAVSLSGTSAMNGSVSVAGTKTSGTTKQTMGSTNGSGKMGSIVAAKTLSMTQKKKLLKEQQAALYPDPTLVKAWNRRLGILYNGSELPATVQEACAEALVVIAEQRECNTLVDAVIAEESDDKVRRLDTRYNKLIESIATFLETQATMFFQCTSNIADFFLRLAKIAEAHRAQQKTLDDKSADEIWDLKEEFRFEREDREALYEAACQKVRESTTQEELEGHFAEVLQVLEEIQQSYRDYHSRACFANDRYPLMLMHDFRGYLDTICEQFFLLPAASHQITTEYERIFDETIRLNKKFFDEDPAAARVGERIPLPPTAAAPLTKIPTAAEKAAAEAEAAAKAQAAAESGEEGAGEADPSVDAEDNAVAVKVSPPEVLRSPVLRQKGKLPPRDMNTGSFYWVYSINAVEARFRDDAAFAVPDPAEEQQEQPAEQAQQANEDSGGGPADGSSDFSLSKQLLKKNPHPDCSYVTEDCPATAMPRSAAELEGMDSEDREDYELALSKHFIALDSMDIPDEEDESAAAEDGGEGNAAGADEGEGAEEAVEKPLIAPPQDNEQLAEMTPEEYDLYRRTKRIVKATKARVAEQEDPAYIRAHPPLDLQKKPWVQSIDVSASEIKKLFGGIRDSFISSLELESKKRILMAEDKSEKAKKELTEQLEERVRNHWPRRGRVETQIKQPREAELLGHKEKTWRHISSIQQKMIQAQESMDECSAAGRLECDQYEADMAELHGSLSGDFKNLASLQGIDVKARSTTQGFQAQAMQRLAELTEIAKDETEAIIFFARDFRKICPPQVPGQEGGYSPSEIAEIEQLVEGQCAEIQSLSEEWMGTAAQLEEQQIGCLNRQEEFSAKYKQCAQDVAMSEGLGQKYGAPRRRAQERIRTEVSRDESRAGKIDTLLAKLDFAVSEAELAVNKPESLYESTTSAGLLLEHNPEVHEHVAPPKPPAEIGKAELYRSVTDWNLLTQLRLSLQQRVAYLRVEQGTLPSLTALPWIAAERIALCEDLGIANGEDLTGEQDLAAIESQKPELGIEAVFEDVDKCCRQETKQLYESEGLASALGEGGVPEALQHWLEENRDKILGRHGYKERAWKRLWQQVQRSEDLLARHLVPLPGGVAGASAERGAATAVVSASLDEHGSEVKVGAKYTTKLGVPAVCLRAMSAAFIAFAKQDKEDRIAEFSQLLSVWEKGREKHERLLRPRLGSPDVVDELNELNRIELERSADLVDNVRRFRSLLVRTQTAHLMHLIEDVSQCSQSMMTLLDTTVRQEVVQVPPDTAIPKKHLTLKKLRKAQRIKEAVAQGGEDRSQSRVWAGIDSQLAAEVVRGAEDMVIDLGSDPADTAVATSKSAAQAAAAEQTGKKGAAAKKPDKNAPPPEAAKPSLIPGGWVEATKEDSAVRGLVSTAHRILISERDNAIHNFTQYVAECMEDIRTEYDSIISKEQSWNERWKRQVEMLRHGNL